MKYGLKDNLSPMVGVGELLRRAIAFTRCDFGDAAIGNNLILGSMRELKRDGVSSTLLQLVFPPRTRLITNHQRRKQNTPKHRRQLPLVSSLN